MSEPVVQKKKNKKKKSLANTVKTPASLTPICQNGVEKETLSINEVLPQKVGMTTIFKDVEVTMTHSGAANKVFNEVLKKKKRKKKAKQQQPLETSPEPLQNEAEDSTSFFKFNEDHIELVNHPEISVTINKTLGVKEKQAPVSEEVPVESGKGQPEVSATSTDTKKKRKRKKKKKSTEEIKNPSEPAAESTDASSTAPTYVKLPASGDNCVLLVSHESFSESKTVSNNNEKSSQNSNETVLVRNNQMIENSTSLPQLSPKMQPNNNVDVSPVALEQKVLSEKTELNMDNNLKKVGDLMKKETTVGDSPANDSITNTAENNYAMPTKAQLKAERRAKQEAQRAAKLAKNCGKESSNVQTSVQVETATCAKEPSPAKCIAMENLESVTIKCTPKSSVEKEMFRKVQVFSHLPQYKKQFSKQFNDSKLRIHSSILEIGSHYRNDILCGSNARCVGFLAAFRDVIRDYKTPQNKEFSRDLESKLQVYLNFLNSCRPLSVSVMNAVKFLKHQINHLSKDINEDKAKEVLGTAINNFVKEDILLAKEAICISATAKIVDGDNIIVFAYSSLVKDVLCKAHDQKKCFHVIVVDSKPKREGLEMRRRLLNHGLQCSYVSIDKAAYIMKKVSKVIIGAHALLSNGCVMSRLGCKQLAWIASTYSVPVLVCCETYKFCERALTDSFVHNELGNPDDLVQLSLDKKESLKNWQYVPSIQIYNILYDVTPSDLISVVITEKGLLPCTSVPVVLRVKHAGLQE